MSDANEMFEEAWNDSDSLLDVASLATSSSSHACVGRKLVCKYRGGIRLVTKSPLTIGPCASKEFLPWVKTDRLECDVCGQFIEYKYKGVGKKSVAKRFVDEEKAFMKEFTAERSKYIEGRNASDTGRSPTIVEHDDRVNRVQEGFLETRALIGIFLAH